jgi:hypothetical protein
MKDQFDIKTTETRIYLEFDEGVQKVLADNNLRIEDILNEEGIDAKVTFGTSPYQEEGARTKDLVTIILASSVLIASIGYSISKVLNVFSAWPHIVKYYVYEELRDNRGNVLFDKEGKPIFKKVMKHEILQPKRSQKDQYNANFDFANGMAMGFTSETIQ